MGLRTSATVALAALAAALVAPSVASADVQHTIGRGHTIDAIAGRYHVTAKAIIEANHLKNVKHLRVGDVLVIPGVKAPAATAKDKPEAPAKAKADKPGSDDHASKKGDKVAKIGKPTGRETTTFAMKAKTPGVIHVHRIATTENYDINVGDKKGRVSPTALKTFEKMMRSQAGMAHPIDSRLAALLGVVSNHFGSRKIEVVSGFRPFTPTQFNPHSNHMHGKAIDFRVAGVPNEALRDFCRTLKNVGCGYYPNSTFVHMDVRDQSTFWIDYSKPGEAPRYNAPNVDADDSASDAHEGSATSNTAPDPTPPDAPAPPASAAPAAPPSDPPGDTGDN